MQKIVIGTANRHKFEEIIKILMPETLDIELIFGGALTDIKPEETGETFFDNALLKANFYSETSGLPTIADDSGLMVDALDGAPGIFSARYAGEGCTYEDNNRKLLDVMKAIPNEKRTARFICTAVLYLPDGKNFIGEGILEGRIGSEPIGKGGFGYDPVFIIPDSRTVAQIPADEKNRISHRAKAFMQIRGILVVMNGDL